MIHPGSRHVARFNHDDDAPEYDRDVRNEQDPIRAGYADLLAWVAAEARLGPTLDALELGSGSGNLTVQLEPCRSLTCVDASRAMTEIAREKTGDSHRAGEIRFVLDDILAFTCGAPSAGFDRVLSTYTIHHLEADERAILFGEIARILRPEGRFVVGDLMFESEAAATSQLELYRSRGDGELADEIADEFFWRLDGDLAALRGVGLEPTVRRFSELSWGICCRRSGPGTIPR